MSIQRIAVCGAGTMGSGIAQVAATYGFKTILFDVNAAVLEKARMAIAKNLARLVEKGKLANGMDKTIQERISFSGNVDDCKADLVIEAIVEKPEIKRSLFLQLSNINDSAAIFASNTSSLSIAALAKELPHPGRFIGLHFFNPAPLMKLVEIVALPGTDTDVITAALSFVKQLQKIPVVCKDAPGFIVNRVARPFYIESLRLAEEGVNLTQIDRLLESAGFKMGPFHLMDLIGNDVNYAVSCSVYEQMGSPLRLQPSSLQKELVSAGKLGKKSGQGYYDYQ